MSLIEQKLNSVRQKGVCIVSGCGGAAKGKMCSTCRARHWRIEHPMKYAYNNIKNRAKQREIEFNLTFEEFKQFCLKTNYIERKKRASDGLTIDRINESKGYTFENIQVLNLITNIKKYYGKTA
jgi:hypothetical protein